MLNLTLFVLVSISSPQEARLLSERADDRVQAPVEPNDFLHPALETAMAGIFQFEQRLLDLGILDENGAPADPTAFEEDSEQASFLIEGEPGVFAGRLGFAFGDLTPSYEPLLECGKHDRGLHAARRLWRERTPVEIEDLLRPLDSTFLEADPVHGTLRAKALHERSIREGALAPLSNGSVAYLIWGFLHLDEYWTGRLHERTEFLSSLIERGASSPLTGAAVLRILQAPLLYDPDQRGQGVAYGLSELRDRVGFTRQHKQQLEALLQLVADVDGSRHARDRSTARESGSTHEAASAVVTEEPRPSPPLEHLRKWAPQVLHWVLLELEPDPLDHSLRRAATLEARKLYWEQLSRDVPYAIYREAMLSELDSILAGLDEHPSLARIEELELLRSAGTLDPEAHEELLVLQGRLKSDRRELLSHIAEFSVFCAGDLDFVESARTLAIQVHPKLATDSLTIVPGYEDLTPIAILSTAWSQIGLSTHPARHALLQDVLENRTPYPKHAVVLMLAVIRGRQEPGYLSLLEGFLAHGTTFERGHALMRSEWISDDRFGVEIGRLFEDSADAGRSDLEREEAWYGAVGSLENRSEGTARKLLLESIRAGHWRDLPPKSQWRMRPDAQLQWVLRTLRSEDLADLRAKGLFPKHLE